jgi:CubicO group peptidase (beta-lactamase class C family)
MNASLEQIRKVLDDAVTANEVPWAVVALVNKNRIVFEHGANANLDRAAWVASATKVPSVLAGLTIIDDWGLRLDDPIAKYLPGFETDKAAMTLRHCMSLTSGLPFNHPTLDPGPDMDGNFRPSPITLEQCVAELAKVPLEAEPGKQFIYGSTSHSVYGRVVEVVANKSWADFFNERLGKPLGFTQATYGPTRNPRLSGGLVMSTREYAQVLRLVLNDGELDGKRIVPANLVREMYRNNGAAFKPLTGGKTTGYGMGWWLTDVPAEKTHFISDAGGQGVHPWIDIKRGYGGIVFIRKTLQDGAKLFERIRPLANQAFDAGALA